MSDERQHMHMLRTRSCLFPSLLSLDQRCRHSFKQDQRAVPPHPAVTDNPTALVEAGKLPSFPAPAGLPPRCSHRSGGGIVAIAAGVWRMAGW